MSSGRKTRVSSQSVVPQSTRIASTAMIRPVLPRSSADMAFILFGLRLPLSCSQKRISLEAILILDNSLGAAVSNILSENAGRTGRVVYRAIRSLRRTDGENRHQGSPLHRPKQ